MGKCRALSIAITFSVISFVLIGCSSHFISKPSFPQQGNVEGKIVFVSDRETPSRSVYVVNADGTNIHPINTGTYTANTPCFSPNGQKIAFEGGRSSDDVSEIFISGLDGKNMIQVTKFSTVDTYRSPKWTSDGKDIFFVKHEGANKFFTIFSFNFDNTKEQKVLSNVGDSIFSVSPDGRFIAYAFPDVNPDIYIKDLKSNTVENITKGKGINYSPAWSPDGKRIAFIRYNISTEVYVMDLKGRNVKQVTNNRWVENYPAWSSDGKKLVYTSYRHGDPWGGGELFIMNLDNMSEWQITKTIKRKNDELLSNDIQASWAK